eukprot:3044883-Pyramimonas_sp.AAC.1
MELFWAIFFPYKRASKRFQRVGYDSPFINLKTVRGFSVSAMHGVQRARQVHLVWHLSHTAVLSWKRVVHVLCTFGKAFIATCIDPAQRDGGPLSSQ